MDTGQRSNMIGGVFPSQRPQYHSSSNARLQIDQKATWQKIEDAEDNDEKGSTNRKKKKKIIKRKPDLDLERPMPNGKPRRPFSSLGVGLEEPEAEIGSQNGLPSKKAMQELKISTLMKPRLTPRNCVSAMGLRNEAHTRKQGLEMTNRPSSIRDNDNQKSDLDFTEKLKAFRKLLTLKQKSGNESDKERQKITNSFMDKLEASGKVLKFNSQSLERTDIQSSSQNYLLTEFQMTYEQDREMKRKQFLFSNDDRGREFRPTGYNQKLINDVDVSEIETKPIISSVQGAGSIDQKSLYDSTIDGALPQTTEKSPKKSCLRVIRRPNSHVQDNHEHFNDADRQFSHSNKTAIGNGLETDKENYSNKVLTSREEARLNRDRVTSASGYTEKVVHDVEQFEDSKKALQRSSQWDDQNPHALFRQRPASVSRFSLHDKVTENGSNVDQNYLLAKQRPNSAVPLSEGQYEYGYKTLDEKYEPSVGVLARGSSLQAHLNVLGASLSSLSSRLNSDSSESDIRSLTSDLDPRLSRSSSLNTLSVSKSTAGTSFADKRPFISSKRFSSDLDLSQVQVTLRDRHYLNTVSSPVTFDSTSKDVMDGSQPSRLKSRHELESSREVHRGDKLHFGSFQNHRENLKPKQTNVTVKDSPSCLYSRESDLKNKVQRGLNMKMTVDRKHVVKSTCQRKTSDSSDADLSDDDVTTLSSIGEHQRDLQETADYIARHKMNGKPKVKAVISRVAKDVSDDDSEAINESEKTLTDQTASRGLLFSPSGKGDDNRISRKNLQRKGDMDEGNLETKRVISRKMLLSKNLAKITSEKFVSEKGQEKKISQGGLSSMPENKTHLVKREETTDNIKQRDRKRILVKRPTGHRLENTRSPNTPDLGSDTAKIHPTRRSKSSIEIFHPDTISGADRSKASPANKTRDLLNEKRPHSSLGNVSNSTKKVTSRAKTIQSGNTEALHCQKDKKNGKDSGEETRRERLYDKVQKLHREIDERLMSEENAVHKTRLKTRLYHQNESTGESSNDVDANQTITSESAVFLSTSSSHKDLGSSQPPSKMKKIHEPDVTMLTSTPLKSRPERANQIWTQEHAPRTETFMRSSASKFGKSLGSEILPNTPRMGIKSLNINVLPNSPRTKLPENVKQVISARERLTPDMSKIRLYASQSSNYGYNDSSDDEKLGSYYYLDDDKDEDETLLHWRHRSGSVGSRRVSNKKDFVSRILGKMAANEKGLKSDGTSTSPVSSGRGQTEYESSQRSPSPADTLLSHLDNPHMVNLLKKLYKADPRTRQIIMIKIQYFTTWRQYSQKAKQKRLWKESMQERADVYCYHRLTARHFSTWEDRATNSRNMRRAATLFRTHMLVKGFRALKWSVSHSRHQSDLLQAKVHTITTRMAFLKWRFRAEKHRRNRMEYAMHRWKQYVTEAQKIRHMQILIDSNTISNIFTTWTKCYNKRVKENLAFHYLRRTTLKHALTTWCCFVSMSKRKKEKYFSAVSLHQNNLIRATFYQMVVSYKKSKKARGHFRQQKLNDVFWAWKQAIQICRSERQADLELSTRHWQTHCIKQTFLRWRERLMLCKAEKHSVSNLCKNAFTIWCLEWQRRVRQREEIEATIERNKLHRALLIWRRNVVQIKRCHKKAVMVIERCHLHHTLRAWRMYSVMRITLRRKIFLHQYAQQKRIQASCFETWLSIFRQRMDDVKARQLWSHRCARKVASHWRQVCRKRFLERQLQDSHIDRKMRFTRAMFNRWLQALEKSEREKEEAEEVRKVLERCCLQRKFQFWKLATEKHLVIKPLVMRREKQRMSQCFNEWHLYVKRVVCCRLSKMAFEKSQLTKAFAAWRSQKKAHEVEKQIKIAMAKGLLLCHLQEWQFFTWRKKECVHFRQVHLVKNTFSFWKRRATTQCSIRAEKEEEEKDNLKLKRTCFDVWRQNSLSQKLVDDQSVGILVQMREDQRLKKAFYLWRKQMHSAIISRSYQKTSSMRLVQTFLSSWHDLTRKTMSLAVNRFAEKIGLTVEDEFNSPSMRVVVKQCSSIQGEDVDFGFLLEDGQTMNSSLNGSLSSTFSLGSSARRLFGDSERSIDSDVDRQFLLSGGLQDVMDEHTAKCLKLRETAQSAILRIQHWPVYTAFQQWVEFTARQRELKESSKSVMNLIIQMETKLAFRRWRAIFLANKLSKERSVLEYTAKRELEDGIKVNYTILSSNFGALAQYCRHRKYVKDLSTKAHRYCMLLAYQKFFPIWFSKTQTQRQEKQVMQLWTTRTEREIELFPLECKLKQRYGNKTLKLCFSVWLLKHRHFEKIQRVYHMNISKWLFDTWQLWASRQHTLRLNMETMLQRRQTHLALQTWKKRFHQSRETEKRFQQSWNGYLHRILVEWHSWTKDTKQRELCYKSVFQHQSQYLLRTYLATWRRLAIKSKKIKSNHEARMICSVFKEWRCVTISSKKQQDKILQMQILSYTLLVKRLFRQWYSVYAHQKLQKEERLKQAESDALKFALVWRQKCQKSRGKQLHQLFQQRQVSLYFQKWKSRHGAVLCIYERMDNWMQDKNVKIMRNYLKHWVIRLHGDQAARLFQGRMLLTMLKEWLSFAKENRERKIRGLALQKALQERSLHVYFQYWKAMTRVKKSIQQNTDMRLQMKIMSSWLSYTRNAIYLRKLQEHMTQRVNTRILTSAFMNMKWRAEYCQNLNEVADRMLQDRRNATMRAVVVLWKDRLDRILAARCYGRILAVRTCRHWCRFVAKRKAEREKDEANLIKAIKFDKRQISKRVFQALKMEVAVSKMAQKRRQRLCDNYAKIWKSRVDLQVTAIEMEWELACRHAWSTWRKEFCRKRAVKNVIRKEEDLIKSQVFKAWLKSLSSGKTSPRKSPQPQIFSRKLSSTSLLPVPVSQARSTPSSSSYSSQQITQPSSQYFGFRTGKYS